MLFRSQPENYNPQIHTEELSLTSQMDKNPAVHNTVISRFKRFTPVTSFLYHTGRVNGGAKQGMIRKNPSKEIADNAYRVQKRTIDIQPAYAMGGAVIGKFHETDDMSLVTSIEYYNGVSSSTVETNVIGSVAIKHEPTNQIFGDKFNIADVIELDRGFGSELYIVGKRRASTNDHYIYDFKVIGEASDWHEDSFIEDEVFMEGGNRYGEGSLKGHQRFWGTSWDIFYNFISRYTISFTGSSLSQQRVIWTDKTLDGANRKANGRGLWQYEVEWEADRMFSIFLELACRYSKSTMDPSDHSWFESSGKNLLTSSHIPGEVGMLAPRTSDGWVTSIKGTLDFSYNVNSGPSVYLFEGVMNLLAGNSPSGQQGNTFLVVTDQLGSMWFDRTFKKALGWNTSALAGGGSETQGFTTDVVQNISSGQNVKLGFNVQSYTYLGNELIVVVDELMSHPGLVGRSGGIAGGGDMIFLNVTPMENGVSNFELFSKSNGRVFKKKYVDGLHSLSSESSFAASGFDGAFCHYLADLFPITYFKDTSCVIRGEGKYSGGALSSIPNQLKNFPAITN